MKYAVIILALLTYLVDAKPLTSSQRPSRVSMQTTKQSQSPGRQLCPGGTKAMAIPFNTRRSRPCPGSAERQLSFHANDFYPYRIALPAQLVKGQCLEEKFLWSDKREYERALIADICDNCIGFSSSFPSCL